MIEEAANEINRCLPMGLEHCEKHFSVCVNVLRLEGDTWRRFVASLDDAQISLVKEAFGCGLATAVLCEVEERDAADAVLTEGSMGDVP